MLSKTTQNLVKCWKAKKALCDRGITHLNTSSQEYYDLVTQKVKEFNFEIDTLDFKTESKEDIIASFDDNDAVRLE
tara:strand:- start:18017 stop:18244 length:228 start_codon:yes stop_codon:yes gene_type:complete